MPPMSQARASEKIADILLPLILIFAVVLVASLFGILTRPMGFLAAVWPANAVLMAMMIRKPSLSTPLGWTSAFLGYLAADILTGGGMLVTLWLTGANMAGALTGYLLFKRLPEGDRRLARPNSIVSMFWICTIAAGVAGAVGGGAARLLFDRDLVTGFTFWFTTELVNAIIVVPLVLTAPSLKAILSAESFNPSRGHNWWPVLALLVSTIAGILLDGPGAIAYPIPALIWCALSYSLFVTSLTTLGFCIVLLIATSTGALPLLSMDDNFLAVVSTRLAIAMTALGPLAVASINDNRDKLVQRLQYLATHDGLTGILGRSAFLTSADEALLRSSTNGQSFSAFMVDVDHFKRINDRLGHATGDKMLTLVAKALEDNVRGDDLVGRLGGEEFAIFCPGLSEDKAHQISERVRAAVEEISLDVDGEQLQTSVSIGMAFGTTGSTPCLRTLLAEADKALYAAKNGGRNRVVAVSIAPPAQHGLATAAA
jgi:diguanylate cyclase (GGDEF)-like protein